MSKPLDQSSADLLRIKTVDGLMERFERTPLPLTRRIALLARIDKKAAEAYAEKLEADEAVVRQAMSLMRTIDAAQNIDALIQQDRAELDLGREEIDTRRQKLKHERDLLGEQHETDLLREKAEQAKLRRLIKQQEVGSESLDSPQKKPTARDRAHAAFSRVLTTRSAVISTHREAVERAKKDDSIPDEDKRLLIDELDAQRDLLLDRLRR